MNAHTLLTDVNQLKSKLCQDYVSMVLNSEWRVKLYVKAKIEVESNTGSKDLYLNVYSKATNSRIDSLCAEDLDIALIRDLVDSDTGIIDASLQTSQTKAAFLRLWTDRPAADLLSSPESSDVLYLYALLNLSRMQEFVETFNAATPQIDPKTRYAFKQKYLPRISDLESIADEERTYLKEIRKYISYVQESSNPVDMWYSIMDIVMKKYYLPKARDPFKKYISFFFKASDAGIPYAHCYALIYASDPSEIEKRSELMLHSELPFTHSDAYYIVDKINACISSDYYSEKLDQILQEVKSYGYSVVKNEKNEYVIE